MPANLTPDYLAAERRFREATSPEGKLEALEAMLATIPKHKGTEKMQADIKRRIARARNELQSRRRAGRSKPAYLVEREGAGQIVLVGPPNVGKSALLAALSHAEPEVADYPFTTRMPRPGMVPFENVQIQLVDLPALDPEFTEGWVYGLIRAADAALVVVSLGDDDLLIALDQTFALLSQHGVALAPPPAPEDATPALLVATQRDRASAEDNLGILREFFGERLPIVAVSAYDAEVLVGLRRRMFDLLDVIRVYTKAPGRHADLTSPFVLPRGSTVTKAAEVVHKDFAERLKYARVWGQGVYPGQMVQRDHLLHDGDVMELHL